MQKITCKKCGSTNVYIKANAGSLGVVLTCRDCKHEWTEKG